MAPLSAAEMTLMPQADRGQDMKMRLSKITSGRHEGISWSLPGLQKLCVHCETARQILVLRMQASPPETHGVYGLWGRDADLGKSTESWWSAYYLYYKNMEQLLSIKVNVWCELVTPGYQVPSYNGQLADFTRVR